MTAKNSKSENFKITITKDGPYMVYGGVPLKKEIISCDKLGFSSKYVTGDKFPLQVSYALCRCGKSGDKPFCDGTHTKIDFDGKETASRKEYLDLAGEIVGPDLILTDVTELCSVGRFCHSSKGDVWDLVQSVDPKLKKVAIKEACDCPSGRLVIWNAKTNKPIEPKLDPSVSLLEDPSRNCSGPIWVKGGIQIEYSDGKLCEKRNRVTLCRCGKSNNKPFCDGNHIQIGFSDEK